MGNHISRLSFLILSIAAMSYAPTTQGHSIQANTPVDNAFFPTIHLAPSTQVHDSIET
ncbi:hypothetical protein DSO57_1020255 [Entomophthora muscae]|uniref:Uncharacterized protein n=2 Tax=Entomophthora muscae TaxID=34485 RepID=A0ACC2SP52_9FUNG|nr:hypothetical protein DSO57_1034543 [Entomophthora muscae]KAJ9084825.1 hypothetical protein DSO57_1020255 [Entomophthora muscae]